MTKFENGLDYGNWVPKRFVYVFAGIGLAATTASILFTPLLIVALLSFTAAIYFVYARHVFSHNGGGLEDRLRALVLHHLDWNGEGEALDIGCGNGTLVIELADKYTQARLVGIDYWGGNWEYSKAACEKNVDIAGIGDRAIFQKASASSLPFPDHRFNAVVSNLVFHEVSYSDDKRELIKEALRVLKKGGAFSFQDLFLIRQVYGDINDLLEAIKGWGISSVEFIPTCESNFIPTVLKLPFMVGTIGIIAGKK